MKFKDYLFLGLCFAGGAAGGIYLSELDTKQKRENELNTAFKAIPIVHTLDSTYNATTKAYHLQRDSLRKVYDNYLEKIVGGK